MIYREAARKPRVRFGGQRRRRVPPKQGKTFQLELGGNRLHLLVRHGSRWQRHRVPPKKQVTTRATESEQQYTYASGNGACAGRDLSVFSGGNGSFWMLHTHGVLTFSPPRSCDLIRLTIVRGDYYPYPIIPQTLYKLAAWYFPVHSPYDIVYTIIYDSLFTAPTRIIGQSSYHRLSNLEDIDSPPEVYSLNLNKNRTLSRSENHTNRAKYFIRPQSLKTNSANRGRNNLNNRTRARRCQSISPILPKQIASTGTTAHPIWLSSIDDYFEETRRQTSSLANPPVANIAIASYLASLSVEQTQP